MNNTQFTNGVRLFELRPRNVIVTRNGANLQYYEVLRIVFRNYTTAFKLCPLMWSGTAGFSRDVVYGDDISWWSLDEMAQLSWERVYV